MSEVDQGFNVLAAHVPETIQTPPAKVPEVLVANHNQIDDFDSFYRSHRSEIGRALAYTLGSVSLAEEAVDEGMARAFQCWSEVSQYDNPAGWVYRAGVNWGKSWKRSAFRRARREEKVALQSAPLQEGAVEVASPADELFRALETLSMNQRSVVVLRHYCDWSVTATAEALGISEGTVKSRSARGLAQLRGILDTEVGE